MYMYMYIVYMYMCIHDKAEIQECPMHPLSPDMESVFQGVYTYTLTFLCCAVM